MVCGHCGATISPEIDRCGVCHTPIPAPVEAGQQPATTEAGFDRELTQLSTGAASSAQIISGSGGIQVLQPGQQFANRYTIIRLLGSGGMAAVYQAWDETLGIAVALKLIRVDANTSALERRELEARFKRELKLARQVSHPNVVRIHDLGDVQGTLYLTMEYVQGADLATLLQRESRLALPRALALARQIASGLAAAHRAGIVHRDLKPANIMVDAHEHALLMDFGIARSTSAASIHTNPGSLIGTLDYMAPEQARGKPADERADVYAFGLILYELVAGGRPRSSNEGGLSTLLARLDKGPPALRTLVPDVAPSLERIVNRCLSSTPEARYPSANELLQDLETLDDKGQGRLTVPTRPAWARVAAIGLLACSLIAGTWWISSRRGSQPSPAARAPLPVLIVDFENRAGDSVFDGALEQPLSIAMEAAPFITAFPRREAAGLLRDLKLGPRLDEGSGRLLASREGIPVILAGMIEKTAGGYRISLRAVTPQKPEPLTVAEATASDKAQVLGAVERVAAPVRAALGDSGRPDGALAETFTTGSLEAVRAYTMAQDLASSQKDTEAVVEYREALRHDPEFGRAYSGLAASLLRLGRRDEAQKNWDEALRRTDRMTDREKLRTFGGYYLGIARNYDKAIETYEELVAKFPSDSAGYSNLAVTHFSLLHFGKALEYGRKAIEIYPKTYKYRANYALYAMYAGDFSTSATFAQALIRDDPNIDVAYLPLAMEALTSGDSARASATYRQAARAGESGASVSAIGLADVAMYEGRYADAIAALPAAAQRDADQGNSLGASTKLVALAEAHVMRNEPAPAEAAMARARKLSNQDNVLVPAARLAVAAGRVDEARAIATGLAARLPAQSRAYGKLIEAEIALSARQYLAAIDALNAAQKLADLWLVRYTLGLAYFQRGDYPEAASEFAKCRERRGEATAIYLDDIPTFRYYATLPYWLGRARAMQKLDARSQFEEFLRIRQADAADPLVADARRRLEAAGR